MVSNGQFINIITENTVNTVSIFTMILYFTALIYFTVKSRWFIDNTYPAFTREPGYMESARWLSRHFYLVFLQFCITGEFLPYIEEEKWITFSFIIILLAATVTIYDVLFRWKTAYDYAWSNAMFQWLINEQGQEYAYTFAALNNKDKINMLYNTGIIYNKDDLGKYAYLLNIKIIAVEKIRLRKF